jgi:hypothetical protein
VLSAGATAFVVLMNTGVRAQGGRNISGILSQAYVEAPLGLGLFFLRKWAALLFSAALLAAYALLIVGSVWYVPWPWALAHIGVGGLLVTPAIITWRYWPELVWGGKWFI